MRIPKPIKNNMMRKEKKLRVFVIPSFRREWVKEEPKKKMKRNGVRTYDH